MRFLDPDECCLRLLDGGNSFGRAPAPTRRRTSGAKLFPAESNGGTCKGSESRDKVSVRRFAGPWRRDEEESRAEAEDFNTLTDSLGGFD